jgi:hypothetical protein
MFKLASIWRFNYALHCIKLWAMLKKWPIIYSVLQDILIADHFTYPFTVYYDFLWRYSPNLGLSLPPWKSPFHFSLLDLRHSVGLLGRVISSSQGLYLYTQKNAHTQKHQTSMPWLGFEPTIPATERAKTVHALDRSATLTGILWIIREMLSDTPTYVKLIVECSVHREFIEKARRLLRMLSCYELPLFASACYWMILWGRDLTPPPTNNMHR